MTRRQLIEPTAFQELHHDVAGAQISIGSIVEDLHDIGMIKLHCQFGFFPKRRFVFFEQDFDGDDSSEFRVASFVDSAETSRIQQSLKLVAAVKYRIFVFVFRHSPAQ